MASLFGLLAPHKSAAVDGSQKFLDNGPFGKYQLGNPDFRVADNTLSKKQPLPQPGSAGWLGNTYRSTLAVVDR